MRKNRGSSGAADRANIELPLDERKASESHCSCHMPHTSMPLLWPHKALLTYALRFGIFSFFVYFRVLGF